MIYCKNIFVDNFFVVKIRLNNSTTPKAFNRTHKISPQRKATSLIIKFVKWSVSVFA